jgi:hypothetical protein
MVQPHTWWFARPKLPNQSQPATFFRTLLEVDPSGDGDVNKQIQASFTANFSDPNFYTTAVQVFGPDEFNNTEWSPEPGWSVDQQSQSAFHQFHWPRIDVNDASCNVRAAGHKNDGDEYTMCRSDLQAYIDQLMPPPTTSTTALAASADTTLLRRQPNRNDGQGPELDLAGGAAEKQIVIRFDAARIQHVLAGHALTSATLRLSSPGRGARERLEIQPLTEDFVEGNGNLAEHERGFGGGAIWNCAIDADISDDVEDCVLNWSSRSASSDHTWGDRARHGGRKHFGAGPEIRPVHYDWRKHQASWDVTDDLRSGIHAWLIRVRGRGKRGPTCVSRQSAAMLRDPTWAPTLLLDRATVEAGSDSADNG